MAKDQPITRKCAQRFLEFWFSSEVRVHWFAGTQQFDDRLREQWSTLAVLASEHALADWACEPSSALALCILLDQIPRNIFRGTPAAFANDHLARRVARHAIDLGFDKTLASVEAQFFYLPLMHSECNSDQQFALTLYEAANLPAAIRYAKEHAEIIQRFGRFPHRNAILGRENTPEESEYLRTAPSGFGQAPLANRASAYNRSKTNL